MEFIKEGSTLPIPLNLIPTPSLAILAMKKIIRIFRKSDDNVSEGGNDVRMKPNGDMNGRLPKGMPNGAANRRQSVEGGELNYRVSDQI